MRRRLVQPQPAQKPGSGRDRGAKVSFSTTGNQLKQLSPTKDDEPAKLEVSQGHQKSTKSFTSSSMEFVETKVKLQAHTPTTNSSLSPIR